MRFPARKIPAALAWYALGRYKRALAGMRGQLRDGLNVPQSSDFQSQYERSGRDG